MIYESQTGSVMARRHCQNQYFTCDIPLAREEHSTFNRSGDSNGEGVCIY